MTEKRKNKGGRPAHVPDDFKRDLVKKLSANGHSQEKIAEYLKISADTLMKYYADEFNNGKLEDELELSEIMRVQARKGNIKAGQFILACRHGWSEKNKIELTGKDEGPINVDVQYKDSLARLLAGIKPEDEE